MTHDEHLFVLRLREIAKGEGVEWHGSDEQVMAWLREMLGRDAGDVEPSAEMPVAYGSIRGVGVLRDAVGDGLEQACAALWPVLRGMA